MVFIMDDKRQKTGNPIPTFFLFIYIPISIQKIEFKPGKVVGGRIVLPHLAFYIFFSKLSVLFFILNYIKNK